MQDEHTPPTHPADPDGDDPLATAIATGDYPRAANLLVSGFLDQLHQEGNHAARPQTKARRAARQPQRP
jgi:hypothetical protein